MSFKRGFARVARYANHNTNCKPLLTPSNSNTNQQRLIARTMATTNGPSSDHVLTQDNVNQNIVHMQYAVRGPIVIRAAELERELKSGAKKPGYDRIIRANIGDCHATGQKPLTWIRQVISLAANPSLAESAPGAFPQDVQDRVKELLAGCGGGSVGAYSDSTGVEVIKRHVADYIKQRDGVEVDFTNVILTTGASEGVKALLHLLNNQSRDSADSRPPGVMIPIPQYPLYSATITELGMHQINYYLDEDHAWRLNVSELERSLKEASQVCRPKALVVINPGNPTGSVLTRDNIEDIVRFAAANRLMIFADEVYQHNVYQEGAAFHSFRKVMSDLGIKLELASFMSCSKGYMGECGLRGGFVEITNFDPAVKALLLKAFSARLCSSILGQIAMDCVVKPPQPGDPSFELHEKEKKAVLDSLKERAKLAADTFNSIPGMSSNPVAGAMYAFPKIEIPAKACAEAESRGMKPDFFYALTLLEETGICIVPGSGFGQIPGTHHFRTTILPQTEALKDMMRKLADFHVSFTKRFT